MSEIIDFATRQKRASKPAPVILGNGAYALLQTLLWEARYASLKGRLTPEGKAVYMALNAIEKEHLKDIGGRS